MDVRENGESFRALIIIDTISVDYRRYYQGNIIIMGNWVVKMHSNTNKREECPILVRKPIANWRA